MISPIMSPLGFGKSLIRFFPFEVIIIFSVKAKAVSIIFPFQNRFPSQGSPFPLVSQAKTRLTKTGLGRLSFSQIFGRETPKSCPGIGDVGDTGKLSR